MIKLTCDHCNKEFLRKKSKHLARLEQGLTAKYCTRECFNNDRSTKYITRNCLECVNEFTRPASALKSGKVIFCSASCSASYNNKVRYGEALNLCKNCDQRVRTKNSYCAMCRGTKNYVIRDSSMDGLTLQDIKDTYKGSEYHAKIRGNSRSVYNRSKQIKECRVCAYSKHIDICHITPVKDYPMVTLVSLVNEISNLVPLCKNHHWEFDHDTLTNEDRIKLDVAIPSIDLG